jgi:hypothetical protein
MISLKATRHLGGHKKNSNPSYNITLIYVVQALP